MAPRHPSHTGSTPYPSTQLLEPSLPLNQFLPLQAVAPLTWDDSLVLILIHLQPGHPLGLTLGLQAAAQVPAAPGSSPSPSPLLLGLGRSACYYCLCSIVHWLLVGCRKRGTITLSAAQPP